MDLSCVATSLAQGVLRVTGTLRQRPPFPGANEAGDPRDLALRLEARLRSLPGVVDVVFDLSNIRRNGNGWEFRSHQ